MKQDKRIKDALKLLRIFLKIGATTFGGGYAMIPIIQREMIHKQKWLTEEELLDMLAISESTPGPIAINTATFVGYRVAGFWGAFCATTGVVLPAFVFMIIVTLCLSYFTEAKAVQYAFTGIRAGVLALVGKALLTMGKKCPRNILSYIIVGLAFVAAAFLEVNVILIVIMCAMIGIVSAAAAKVQKKG